MKRSSAYRLLFICSAFFAVVLLYACTKEFSCEHCENAAPIARAGEDRIAVADTVMLDGSASSDPDGRIVKWKWRSLSQAPIKISAPDAAKTSISGMKDGRYLIELTVFDDLSQFGKDTVTVTVPAGITPADTVVTAKPKRPPIANAGQDQFIDISRTTSVLDGSLSFDPDGDISSYLWRSLPGAGQLQIPAPNRIRADVSGLSEGQFDIELTVTDSTGLFSRDTVRLYVFKQQLCADSSRPIIRLTMEPVGRLSRHRASMAAAAAGGKILIGNGLEETNENRVDLYDIRSGSTQMATLSDRTVRTTAVSTGRYLVIADGVDRINAPTVITSKVDFYDVTTNTWFSENLSVPRVAMAVAVAGEKVFFAGGISIDGTTHDLVEVFDISTRKWERTRLSEPRAFMCAISKGDKVYFSGGSRNDIISTKLDILDISNGSWQTSRLLEPRSGHSAAVIDGNIFWVGGMTSSPMSASMASCSVEIMNASTMERTTTYLFTPSSPGTAMVYKGYLVVYSGWTSHLDIYNPVTKEWVVGEIPEKILAAAVVATSEGIFISGGVIDAAVSGIPSEQIWKINF